MATSSIKKTFVISDKKSAKSFLNALEASLKDPKNKPDNSFNNDIYDSPSRKRFIKRLDARLRNN